MKLRELLHNINTKQIDNFKNIDIKGVSCDSRFIRKGEIFIALKGSLTDGHQYLNEAIEAGAICLVIDYKRSPLFKSLSKEIILVRVNDTKRALILIAHNFYKRKIKDLKLIGVTGTNGKTTITYLVESILQTSGFKTGLIGTIEYCLPNHKQISINTTPGLIELYRYFLEMEKENIDYCIMEVSSHALDQGRLGNLGFQRAIFTNISRDHLDYHKNFKDYFMAKSKLFSMLAPDKGCGIINVDDSYGRRLLRKKMPHKLSYAISRKANVLASDIKLDIDKTKFLIKYKDVILPIKSKLLGLHNVYNILAATALALSMNIKPGHIIKGINNLKEVVGRLQLAGRKGDVKIFIDYAHTPVALKMALKSFSVLKNRERKCKIILVFGCGGERDRAKRPQMGRIASCFSDLTFITTDNPRSENPDDIIADIRRGFLRKNYIVVKDRYKAIKKAIHKAKENDVVLIAGKGHECVQIFDSRVVDFDDKKAVYRALDEA
ncbi:MAG: UDP-N-acetylmuramoyl-L-alanyl-D-glutamate--2,6-diaminopimelate ligase [Candidatus Omnitrophica bacterium]|nr:UDP-N-acetylmuramoyl-L-alanyl-D-glutamate--2,6-diaminopimelate ligase [Candidatus Omnitrophota bacterium]